MVLSALAADLILYLHFAVVVFLVGGELAALAGGAFRWNWVRNRAFRSIHFGLMGFVAFEAVAGIWCPLTILEYDLRLGAGGSGDRMPFIAGLVRSLIFYDLPPWVFTLAYVAFFALIAATLRIVPPEKRKREIGYAVEALDEYIKLQEATNDHMMRAVLEFSKRLEPEKFKAALAASIGYVPILACVYSAKGDGAVWKPSPYEEADLFRIVAGGEENELLDCLRTVPKEDGPHVLASLIRREGNDALVVVVDHMVFDGAGFKAYLRLLAALYSGDTAEARRIAGESAHRDMDTLIKNIPLAKRVAALGRKTFRGGGSPLDHEGKAPSVRLGLLRIEGETFAKIRSFGKRLGVTFNDFALALLCSAISALDATPRIGELTLQTMIDLRRYVSKHPVSPFGNFSSMESLRVRCGGRPLSETAVEIGNLTRRVKSRLPGVKNVLLMNAAWKFLGRKRFDSSLSAAIRSIGVSASNLGVIDEEDLRFSGVEVADAYLLASVKEEPSFQLTFSTFRDRATFGFLGSYSGSNWARIEGIIAAMRRAVEGI